MQLLWVSQFLCATATSFTLLKSNSCFFLCVWLNSILFFVLVLLLKFRASIICSLPVTWEIRVWLGFIFNSLIRVYTKQRCHWSLMPSFRLVVSVRWIKPLRSEIYKIAGISKICRWRPLLNALIWSSPSLSFTCIIGNCW